MNCFPRRKDILILFIPLFGMGFWLIPGDCLGHRIENKLSTLHLHPYVSTSSARVFRIKGVRSRSMAPTPRHRPPLAPRGNAMQKKHFFKHHHHRRRPSFLFAPYASESSERIRNGLSEEQEIREGQPQLQVTPYKSSPPLIFEERCGKFIKIPWPESGRLIEVDLEENCPDSE